MNTEAQNYSAGDFVDYTPGSAVVAGQIVQIGNRAAMCATAIAASALGAAQIRGIVKARAAAVTGNVGDLVGWDDDGDPYGDTAGLGAATTILANADYLLGTLAKALTATDGEAQIDLNVFDVVQTASVTWTSAQILLLATTQIELLAAPGADRFSDVHSITFILDYGSNVFTEPSAPDDLEVVYDAAGGTSIADVIGDFIINSADTIARPQIKNNAGVAVTTIVNKAVVLDNNGANYGGNAGDDSTLTVIINYSVRRAGLA